MWKKGAWTALKWCAIGIQARREGFSLTAGRQQQQQRDQARADRECATKNTACQARCIDWLAGADTRSRHVLFFSRRGSRSWTCICRRCPCIWRPATTSIQSVQSVQSDRIHPSPLSTNTPTPAVSAGDCASLANTNPKQILRLMRRRRRVHLLVATALSFAPVAPEIDRGLPDPALS
jgi:hypothetical protein